PCGVVVCPCCVPLFCCWAPFWSCFCVSDWPDFGCAESRFICVWPRSPAPGWLLVPRSIWPPPRSICVPWPVVERSPAPPLAPPFGPPLSIFSAGAAEGAPPPAPPAPPAPPVPPCMPWAETAIVPAARAAAATVANNVFLISVPPCRPRVDPTGRTNKRRDAASVPMRRPHGHTSRVEVMVHH